MDIGMHVVLTLLYSRSRQEVTAFIHQLQLPQLPLCFTPFSNKQRAKFPLIQFVFLLSKHMHMLGAVVGTGVAAGAVVGAGTPALNLPGFLVSA